MKKNWILFVAGLILVTTVSQSSHLASGLAAPLQKDAPGLEPVDVNMHDFMEGVFQGPYRRLKETMVNEPTDNAGWKQLRGDALILAEGGNLLLTRVPEEGSADWQKYSIDVREAGEKVVLAAKQKDYSTVRTAYVQMLEHCNSCHKQFEKGRHILTP